ncbi:hypothetical protein [Micromonospora haikouensis]|uniref:hypothetical protein n=1 Tax=Micromonospora haikouensis TaxID=686309 RepID=UPI0033E88274
MVKVVAEIGGHRVDRAAILRWEDRRIDAAASKLGVPAPRPGDVAGRREAFLRTKLDLGAEEMSRRLARDTRMADLVARAQARVSDRRRFSVTDLRVDAGNAAAFTAWFEDATNSSDEAAMMRACPDHFVLRLGSAGQEVLETNGASPLAAFFVIDYGDLSSLRTPADPAFPHQIAGVARASNGRAIGGVRHQFRDTGDGFDARLTVEFPLPTLPAMVAGHRWHLACEFANWIEAASA